MRAANICTCLHHGKLTWYVLLLIPFLKLVGTVHLRGCLKAPSSTGSGLSRCGPFSVHWSVCLSVAGRHLAAETARMCACMYVCAQIYCARVQTEHPGFYYRYAATHARERKRLSDALCGGEHATVTQGEAVYVGQPVLIVDGKTLSPEETTLEHICVGSASHSGRYNACLYAQPADHEPVTTYG